MRVCQFRHFGINVAPDRTRRCDGKYSSILKGLLNVSNPSLDTRRFFAKCALLNFSGPCKSVFIRDAICFFAKSQRPIAKSQIPYLSSAAIARSG